MCLLQNIYKVGGGKKESLLRGTACPEFISGKQSPISRGVMQGLHRSIRSVQFGIATLSLAMTREREKKSTVTYGNKSVTFECFLLKYLRKSRTIPAKK